MKKSSVSYGMILNLKPSLGNDLLISKRCLIGAGLEKMHSAFSQVNRYQTPPHSPLNFPFTLHTYVCCYLEESLWLNSCQVPFLLVPAAWPVLRRRTQDNDVGSRSSLLSPVRPSQVSRDLTYPSPQCELTFSSPFFSLTCKTRALVGMGGVVTRTAAVQGAGLSLAVITLLL